ncbi:hypothetical protein [Mycoplasma seminis]|uniref:Uncharacterized protein n=1 Tax=Mycoplasma seminis TaxID=512749 RepID=A0ABY9HD25_9MOLU|nr:hypothetical protein [Mycoplasma seminis]WLP85578.1 hypothetical protein Q8852_00165 [Mycoplasma seminis]
MDSISFLQSAPNAQPQSANTYMDSFVNALKWINNNMGNVSIWLPIVLTIVILISFVIGFFYRYKWSIFKLVNIALTMVISIIAYTALEKTLQAYIKDQKEVQLLAKSALPFAITLLALVFYLSIWVLFFIICSIVQLATIGRRKHKQQQRVMNGKAANNNVARFIWGSTNAILTIPGALLVGNILTTAIPYTNSTTKSTTWGVKILTLNKGGSLSGIGSGIAAGYELYTKGSKLFELLQKNPSEWNKENIIETLQALQAASNLLNNEQIQNVISEASAQYASDIVQKSGAVNTVKNYEDELIKKDPTYLTLTTQKQKDALTKYIATEITQATQDAIKDAGKEAEEYLNITKYVIASVNEETQDKLINIFASVLNTNSEINSKVNTNEIAKAWIETLAKTPLPKDNQKASTQASLVSKLIKEELLQRGYNA